MATNNSHLPYGDPKAMVQQAAGLFATHLKRRGKLAQLVGKMPTGESGAISTINNQTTSDLPIVRTMDLSKGKGDEVRFNLVNPFGAVPIMGSRLAEGRGTGLSLAEDRLRVNQARIPINLGDTMTTLRSPADFRKFGRPVAEATMNRYIDQSYIVHLAGARGSVDNLTWSVPLESDERFNEVMVNPVKAPSKNRHFIVSGNYVDAFSTSGGAVALTSADKFSMAAIDSMRAVMDEMVLPPPIVKFDGDSASEDEPLRVMLVTNAQYALLQTDPSFRSIQAKAMARANIAKDHPIFRGEVGLWNNFLIIKQNYPIRFFAGDTVKYCSDHRGTEASTVIDPSLGAGLAVDRAIILGGQALAEAFAKSEKSGIPFFWSEKEFDHGDKFELLIGTIRGVSKTRFDVNEGDQNVVTDYGVCVLDTVVNLNKV